MYGYGSFFHNTTRFLRNGAARRSRLSCLTEVERERERYCVNAFHVGSPPVAGAPGEYYRIRFARAYIKAAASYKPARTLTHTSACEFALPPSASHYANLSALIRSGIATTCIFFHASPSLMVYIRTLHPEGIKFPLSRNSDVEIQA